jgi:hypothetical protein
MPTRRQFVKAEASDGLPGAKNIPTNYTTGDTGCGPFKTRTLGGRLAALPQQQQADRPVHPALPELQRRRVHHENGDRRRRGQDPTSRRSGIGPP